MAISFQNALLGKNEVARQAINNLVNDPRYLQQQKQLATSNLQAAIEKEKAAYEADRPILESLGKWGGGLIDVFRNSSKNFDVQMAAYGGEKFNMPASDQTLMNALIGLPQYRLGGFQAPGGPKVDYLGIIDAYKKAGAWNPMPALQMMKDFNQKYGLGLTPEQMAKGADEFGAFSKKKFGVNFIPSSNDLAIAMSSLSAAAGALDNYGTSEGMAKMWAENSPQLARWDQEAIKRQQSLADSFNSDIGGRSKEISKYYQQYMDALDKQDKAENKAFVKQALGTVASAFVPGLGQAFGGGILGNAGAGALVGGGTAAITGGDIGKGVLTGGLTGGLQGANLGGQAANYLNKAGELGLSANALKAIGTGINSGLGTAGGSLINGGSLGNSLKIGLLGGAASGAGSYAGSMVGGLAKDAGLGNFLSKGLGSFAGGTTTGLLKGQTLGNALTGGAIGAGAGMVGGLLGGGDLGKFANSLTSEGLKYLLQQRPNSNLSRGVASGVRQARPQMSREQMLAVWTALPSAQKQALLAKYKGN